MGLACTHLAYINIVHYNYPKLIKMNQSNLQRIVSIQMNIFYRPQ